MTAIKLMSDKHWTELLSRSDRRQREYELTIRLMWLSFWVRNESREAGDIRTQYNMFAFREASEIMVLEAL